MLATAVGILAASIGGCANQTPPPQMSVWEFGANSFEQSAAAPSVEFGPTPDESWSTDEPQSDGQLATDGESRWRTRVIPDRSYEYRGGRDPATGAARLQM